MFTTKARYTALGALGLVLVLSLASCSVDGGRAVLDLVPLQRKLVAEYEGTKIHVDLQNGHRLGITLSSNTPSDLAYQQSAVGAREVAEFVCRNYPSMDQIDSLRVAFGVHEGGLLADAKISASYTWEQNELPCGFDG